jgi:glycine/serine hydroxymethyltransferase
MKEKEMKEIAGWLSAALKYRNQEKVLKEIKKEVKNLVQKFPVP